MTFNLEEPKDISCIKVQRNNWRKCIFYIILILALTAMLTAIFSVLYKKYYQYKNEQAADLFEQFFSLHVSNKNSDSLKILQKLQQQYSHSISTTMATLIQAGVAFESNQLDMAKKYYLWVINNQSEPNIQTIAILRFATVLVQEKKYNVALEFLTKNKIDPFYEVNKLDLQGDIYNELGQKNKAIENYNKALSHIENHAIKEYFKKKLSVL